MTEAKVLTETESVSLTVRQNDLPISQSRLNFEQQRLFGPVLTHPSGWQDGITRPLLYFVGEYLRRNGVADQNIKAGLLVYTAMNSVRLGYPQSVVLLAEDYGAACHLLEICREIAPENAILEVQELKREQLYSDQADFRRKVLICYDTSAVVKAMPDLLNLITLGRATQQADFKSKFGAGMRTFEAQYPMSFIGIGNSAGKKPVMNHPSIIRVPVSKDSYGNGPMPSLATDLLQETNEREFRRIATIFERLYPRAISIPYFNPILELIAAQRPENLPDKVKIVKKVISLSSIMGDPPLSSLEELLDDHIKALKTVRSRLLDQAKAEGLEAGKLDYYQTALLLDEVLGIGSKAFTRLELQVFDAVKAINSEKAGMAMINQNAILEKLIMLPRIPDWWAYMNDIMGTLNKSVTGFTAAPEIEVLLGNLKAMKVIGVKQGESNKGVGYFILVPKIDSYLRLPELKQINHPAFLGPPIKVMNPITGLEEEI
jgi:hypothetical protein